MYRARDTGRKEEEHHGADKARRRAEEATAVLKDLAGVVKTLNDQGTELEGTECGVVLLPPVEQEEKE